MMVIETAESYFARTPGTPGAERVIHLHWYRRDVARFVPTEIAPSPVAVAVVNYGRWIVRCPFCRGAQFAARDDRRFFCTECLNEAVARRWIRVRWPAAATITGIDEALLARPGDHWRNWEPGASVVQLLAENAAGNWHHSWSTPRDWTTGEIVTASIMNTHVRDEFNEAVAAQASSAVLAIQVFG